MTETAGDLSTFEDDRDPTGQPYPPFASTPEQRRRWDYSLQAAQFVMGDGEDSMLGEGPTPSSSADIPMAARALYFGDIPTGDPPEAVQPGHPLAQQPQAEGEGPAAEPPAEPAEPPAEPGAPPADDVPAEPTA